MRFIQRNLLLYLLMALVSSPLAAAHNQSAAPTWDNRITVGQLTNGLNYYLYHSPAPTDPFNIRVIVHAGAIDETEVKGIAHAVEHMVFNQTAAHPQTVHQYLRRLGWQSGRQINAVTRPTATHYMIRTRPEDALTMPEALSLLADMLGHATFKTTQWQLEQQIITEEKRLTNRVAERLNQQVKQATKANSKYAQAPIIGTYESIKNIHLNELQDFYQRYYVASNMSLVISGRFDPETIEQQIAASFGQLPKRPKPQRELNFPLDNQVKFFTVQDAQGTSAKVALGLRMAMPAKYEAGGLQMRLENYLIRKLLRQVRHNNTDLPDSVDALYSVLKDPTPQRLTLAFSAITHDHDVGLQSILREMARLQHYGLDKTEFKQVVADARATIERNLAAATKRDYKGWEDKISAAVLDGSVLSAPLDVAQRNRQMLEQVTLARLNSRLRELLQAADIFVYYQAPAATKLTLPTTAQFRQWQSAANSKVLHRPAPAIANTQSMSVTIAQAPAALTIPRPQGAALGLPTRRFEDHQVREWSLSNGWRVVWLRRPTADGRLYLKAISAFGAYLEEYPAWLAQAAMQLHQQYAPAGLDDAHWQAWQQAQSTHWSAKLNDYQLDLSTAIAADELETALLQLWLAHQPRRFDAFALQAAKDAINELADDSTRQYLWPQAERSNLIPDSDAAKRLTIEPLQQAAQRLMAQPKTLFMVGELPTDRLTELAGQYLTSLPQDPPLTRKPMLQRSGKHRVIETQQGEPQTRVTIYGQTPMVWSPERAFLLSTLNPITQQALRQKLRLELGGVYRVAFEMNLNPNTDQVTSQLSFTTAPEKAQPLTRAAAQVLVNLPTAIASVNLERLQADVRFAEQNRLRSPTTWLRRLMLSYRRYNDPRYLASMRNLADSLSKETLRALSADIFPMPNQVTVYQRQQPEKK